MNGPPESTEKNSSSAVWIKPVILVVFMISIVIIARFFGIGEKIEALRALIESLGTWGMLVFVVVYIVSTVAALPGSAVTVAAGALFGSFFGVILVSISSTIGAALCFLISRYFARDSIKRMFAKNKSFQRLDSLTEEHGAVIVALTRLVPVFPFNILNYGFGLTKVVFKDYVFWSWLCMLPGTVLYVVGADAITKALSDGKIPWPLIGVTMVMIIILAFLVSHARNKLKSKENSNAVTNISEIIENKQGEA
ncbi:TVP38/TMEM64 family protein [Candidatus Latescibacterota bacterium]